MKATSSLVADTITKVQVITDLPILLSRPAFTNKMRWTSVDDICYATNEIQRALKHFSACDMPIGHLVILLSFLNGGRCGHALNSSPLKKAKTTITPSKTLMMPFFPQSTLGLSDLSKFESPLARLDLSFLSTLAVTSPSSDPKLDPIEV
ncbi:hypothetical protein GH714_043403 [Hevea brasiliensis]|uniref:Uncharacterized protein n=1 Tax=Hevea brasiliensis TaxID=3981 RepID=A0A6A6K1T5_HEVBR|nr:hypothetical protein GH714_043403 [Hevea brasiliensis]